MVATVARDLDADFKAIFANTIGTRDPYDRIKEALIKAHIFDEGSLYSADVASIDTLTINENGILVDLKAAEKIWVKLLRGYVMELDIQGKDFSNPNTFDKDEFKKWCHLI